MAQELSFSADPEFERAIRNSTGKATGPVFDQDLRAASVLQFANCVRMSSVMTLPAGTHFTIGERGGCPYVEGLVANKDVIFGAMFQSPRGPFFMPGVWGRNSPKLFVPGWAFATDMGVTFIPGVFASTAEGPLFAPGIYRGTQFGFGSSSFSPGLYLNLQNSGGRNLFAALASCDAVSGMSPLDAQHYAASHARAFLPGAFALTPPSPSSGSSGQLSRGSMEILAKAQERLAMVGATTGDKLDSIEACAENVAFGAAACAAAFEVPVWYTMMACWTYAGKAGYDCAKMVDTLVHEDVEVEINVEPGDFDMGEEAEPPEMKLVPLVPSSSTDPPPSKPESSTTPKPASPSGTPTEEGAEAPVPGWLLAFLGRCGLVPPTTLKPKTVSTILTDSEHGSAEPPKPVNVHDPGVVDPTGPDGSHVSGGNVISHPPTVVDPVEVSVSNPVGSWSPVTDPGALGVAAALSGAGHAAGHAGGAGDDFAQHVLGQIVEHAAATSYCVEDYYQKIVDNAKRAGLKQSAYSSYEKGLKDFSH
jgi:hypothetical protein